MAEFGDKYHGDIGQCLRGLQRERHVGGQVDSESMARKRKWTAGSESGPSDAESSRAVKSGDCYHSYCHSHILILALFKPDSYNHQLNPHPLPHRDNGYERLPDQYVSMFAYVFCKHGFTYLIGSNRTTPRLRHKVKGKVQIIIPAALCIPNKGVFCRRCRSTTVIIVSSPVN